MNLSRRLAALALAGIAALGAASALAQPYPAKPIRIIVPFGPGGSGDILARTFAQYLESQTRQSVVVDNKPGANGIIGSELAKNAAPDGYTLVLSTNTTHAANVSLYKKLPYDPVKDFDNIASFGTMGSVAVVPPGSHLNSIPALVAYAKANPGKVFFGHYNSASRMAAELFRVRTGAPLTGVPYKTIGNAITDLLGGQIQVLFLEYASGASHIEGGKLHAIGVTGAQRHRTWTTVPAIAEFYPGFELTAYLALAAPAKTPPEIADALNGWMNKAIADPAVRARLDQLGMSPKAMTREEMRRFVQQEIDRWVTYTKAAGIEPE
jgi:tripartite-type tricarboxylate transporter receptor subunit TctC